MYQQVDGPHLPGGALSVMGSLLVHSMVITSLDVRLFRFHWNVLWPGPCGMFSLAASDLFSHFAVGKLSGRSVAGAFCAGEKLQTGCRH